jgi:hypothetical protein
MSRSRLVARVNLQIKLYSVRNSVVLQRDRVLERPFALPAQHDLPGVSSNASRNQLLELADGIRGQARNRGLGAKTIVDVDYNQLLARRYGCRLLLLLFLLICAPLVVFVPVGSLGPRRFALAVAIGISVSSPVAIPRAVSVSGPVSSWRPVPKVASTVW